MNLSKIFLLRVEQTQLRKRIMFQGSTWSSPNEHFFILYVFNFTNIKTDEQKHAWRHWLVHMEFPILFSFSSPICVSCLCCSHFIGYGIVSCNSLKSHKLLLTVIQTKISVLLYTKTLCNWLHIAKRTGLVSPCIERKKLMSIPSHPVRYK